MRAAHAESDALIANTFQHCDATAFKVTTSCKQVLHRESANFAAPWTASSVIILVIEDTAHTAKDLASKCTRI
jgi:hypothetical protein